MHVISLDHIHSYADDPDMSARFYTEHFDAKPIPASANRVSGSRTLLRFVEQLSEEPMRKALTTIAIAFCLILAVGLFLQTDSNFSFEYAVNGQPAGGPLGALRGAAGLMLALVVAGFGLLVAVFAAFGVSLLLAGLFVGLGLTFLFVGFPFAAPLVVVAAVVWVIARRPREA